MSRPRWIPQALLLLVSTAFSVAVAEGVFRAGALSHPELKAELILEGQRQPGTIDLEEIESRTGDMVHGAFLDFRFESDRLDPTTTRILFLGDSFTQGAGLQDLGDRFSDLLEDDINGHPLAVGHPPRVDILNAGIGGSNPLHWERYFRRIESAYAPDLVFAIFFLRDGVPIPTSLILNPATAHGASRGELTDHALSDVRRRTQPEIPMPSGPLIRRAILLPPARRGTAAPPRHERYPQSGNIDSVIECAVPPRATFWI